MRNVSQSKKINKSKFFKTMKKETIAKLGLIAFGTASYVLGRLAKPKDTLYQKSKTTNSDGTINEVTTFIRTQSEPEPKEVIVQDTVVIIASSTEPAVSAPAGTTTQESSTTRSESSTLDVNSKIDHHEKFTLILKDQTKLEWVKAFGWLLLILLVSYLLFKTINALFDTNDSASKTVSLVDTMPTAKAAALPIHSGTTAPAKVDESWVKEKIFESVSQHSLKHVISNIQLSPDAFIHSNVAMLWDYRKDHEKEPNGNIHRRIIKTEYPQGTEISYEHVDYPDASGKAGTGRVNLLQVIDGKLVTTQIAQYDWVVGKDVTEQ